MINEWKLVKSLQEWCRRQLCGVKEPGRAALDRPWILANHKFMSLHAAALFPYYIDSIKNLFAPDQPSMALGVFHWEVAFFLVMTYVTYHVAISVHEMGHYFSAVKARGLHEPSQSLGETRLKQPFLQRLPWIVGMFLAIPWGKFDGIKKSHGNFKVNGPHNLRVAAAGPLTSGYLALVCLSIAALLMAIGYASHSAVPLYVARPFLGLGVVGGLDYWRSDPGQLRMYREMQATAAAKAERVAAVKDQKLWIDQVRDVKSMLSRTRKQVVTFGDNLQLKVPWPYRNSGMGGRHTEKEYPESNISMQETMFVPLSWENYEENQRMTVELQTRLKEIIESADGARVMGIGTEGGLAAYIEKEPGDLLPEQRLWRMAKQAIEECGYVPGRDVALALDPALSELAHAYREKFEQPDAIGMYLAWRDKEQVVMTREEVFELYRRTLEEENIPIVSIEDGFAEDDYAGWQLLMREMGDKILIIGDDLVTTKDSTIERAADEKWTNAILIKANQIGTLSETMAAILVSLGKGQEIVVSHRSKSPNDDMEAQIALAANALGLKAGGGANTERLVKYGSVMKVVKEAEKYGLGGISARQGIGSLLFQQEKTVGALLEEMEITDITAYEEPTNAGIPTVGVTISIGIPGSAVYRKLVSVSGSTPLGASTGTDEAVHLVDSTIPRSPVVEKYPDLFSLQPDKTYCFAKGVTDAAILERNDEELSRLWSQAQRYNGKGCLNAVHNVESIISKAFLGRKVKDLGSIIDIDRELLHLELETAIKRGALSANASREERIAVMQRKGHLGMNAILSMSLALSRIKAAVEGKHLWQLMRHEMTRAMACTLIHFAGANWLSFLAQGLDDPQAPDGKLRIDPKTMERLAQAVAENPTRPQWHVLQETISFEDLVLGLRMVNAAKRADVKLYELIRVHLNCFEKPGEENPA